MFVDIFSIKPQRAVFVDVGGPDGKSQRKDCDILLSASEPVGSLTIMMTNKTLESRQRTFLDTNSNTRDDSLDGWNKRRERDDREALNSHGCRLHKGSKHPCTDRNALDRPDD